MLSVWLKITEKGCKYSVQIGVFVSTMQLCCFSVHFKSFQSSSVVICLWIFYSFHHNLISENCCIAFLCVCSIILFVMYSKINLRQMCRKSFVNVNWCPFNAWYGNLERINFVIPTHSSSLNIDKICAVSFSWKKYPTRNVLHSNNEHSSIHDPLLAQLNSSQLLLLHAFPLH